jgi:hypothetical protein
VDILKAHGTLTPEQITYIDAHSVILDLAPATASAAIATEAAAPAESTERLIKGKTTFQEILDWGVSQDVIEQIIGAPLPATSLTVKDYCTQQGLNFEIIKSALQTEVDKISQ